MIYFVWFFIFMYIYKSGSNYIMTLESRTLTWIYFQNITFLSVYIHYMNYIICTVLCWMKEKQTNNKIKTNKYTFFVFQTEDFREIKIHFAQRKYQDSATTLILTDRYNFLRKKFFDSIIGKKKVSKSSSDCSMTRRWRVVVFISSGL